VFVGCLEEFRRLGDLFGCGCFFFVGVGLVCLWAVFFLFVFIGCLLEMYECVRGPAGWCRCGLCCVCCGFFQRGLYAGYSGCFLSGSSFGMFGAICVCFLCRTETRLWCVSFAGGVYFVVGWGCGSVVVAMFVLWFSSVIFVCRKFYCAVMTLNGIAL